MPKNSIYQNIAFLGIVLFVISCGQRGAPTGGSKDETPPKIKASEPLNYSTNFSGQKIEIKFDEYVQVRSFHNEFLISPPVPVPPEYHLRGKKLILEFDSAFTPNTTYTLFFGKSIVDLNESNPLDSNIFVFSTGEFIDSLSLEGSLYDGATLVPEKEMMVLLYKNLNDSAPLKVLPSYFAPVKQGRFKFTNLAEGNYRIFALQDANHNYKYDLVTEKIAFSDQIIVLPKSENDSTELVLYTFLPAPKEQKAYKPNSSKEGVVKCTFALPAKSASIIDINGDWPKDSIIEEWSKNRDTLTLYSSAFTAKRQFKILVHTDTTFSDTTNLLISKVENKFQISTNFSVGAKNNFNDSLKFFCSEPIAESLDSIMIVGAGDSLYLPLNKTPRGEALVLNYTFLPGENYRIVMPDSCIKTILSHYNDSLEYTFTMQAEGVYGNLLLHPKFESKHAYIFQLTAANQLVREMAFDTVPSSIEFKGLTAGEYQLKVIVDADHNGRWSPGSYHDKKAPEKIILYPKGITVRSNWDMEIDWILE